MIVAVESNFVLEVALAQEQAGAAEEILEQAERGEIELAIPSFSLAEPFSTITKRDRDRKRLSSTLDAQARDLRRSIPHQRDVTHLASVVGVLVELGQQETDRLVATIERLFAAATVISVDLLVFQRAMQYRSMHGLSEPDAIIYAAILSHLASSRDSGPHYFMSKNSKDFGTPSIARELGQFDCTFVADFDFIADEIRNVSRTKE